ncbi:hypothetical protein ROZALSC1DRAFT_26861 [Rozella allomycis CSF55]|uniref:Uncharacterized protein n=1 Tax=Rozella allomycis (strain CSF55) TaxID=988480 RepID=A0A075ATE9_ROZAC|nr:hypothetical protein O9G_001279 [Rozella allomycis CSF55]RKP21754.1 hypothetical protein ROZALSC1DRAFT_26861 [Rozella allomycis CSF55]|eukprot:EPZ33528.1 hypothetical protein O9G_001279 [Rozella allomycis CSF55]
MNVSILNNKALIMALKCHWTDCIEVLVKHKSFCFSCTEINLIEMFKCNYVALNAILKYPSFYNREQVHEAVMSISKHADYIPNLMLLFAVDESFCKDSFVIACENGNFDLVEYLVSTDKVDPAVFDNHAIKWASSFGHDEIVKYLISDKRVDPTAENNAAIRWACQAGHAKVVEILLSDVRVNPNASFSSCLINSCKAGHCEVVKLLLDDWRIDLRKCKEKCKQLAKKELHLDILSLLNAR